MLKRFLSLLVPTLGILSLTGCALGQSALQYTPWGSQTGAGFFTGMMDGFLSTFCLVISIFTSQVRVYRTPNIGVCYDLGFAFGLIIFLISMDSGSGGSDGKRVDSPNPDPGKPESTPSGPTKKRGITIRGIKIKIPGIHHN